MKRTAATFLLVAGLGGCVSPDKPGTQVSQKRPAAGTVASTEAAPKGTASQNKTSAERPSLMAKMSSTNDSKSKTGSTSASQGANVVQVSANEPAFSDNIEQTTGFTRVIGPSAVGCPDGSCGTGGGMFGRLHGGHGGHFGKHHGFGCGPDGCPGPYNGYTQSPYGPMANGFELGLGQAGIMPAPSMGQYGAVAAVGAFGAGRGAPGGPMYANQRTSIRFVSPNGMRVSWLTPDGSFTDDSPLEAPARYNFPQGNTYRLKVTALPNRPGVTYYPTLEVYPATPRTVTYLSHNAVPIGFTDDDLDQVRAGNLVVKVIYLPHEAFQDEAAVAGADEVVSTRLEPGIDPIVEANRRGTILAVIRMGNIDLEDPNTPAMDGPQSNMGGNGPAVMAPSSMPIVSEPARTPASLPNAVKMPISGTTTSIGN